MNEMMLRTTTPVVINSFDQLTFLRPMVQQLCASGFKNIIIIDQNSSYEPLRSYLKEGSQNRLFTLLTMSQNVGPRHFFSMDLLEAMPRFFFYTDPDLSWPAGIAPDMVSRFMELSEKYKVGKVGSALMLPDEQIVSREQLNGQPTTVRQWQEQFWRAELEPGVYNAPVETTWHLVNRTFFTTTSFTSGIRVAGDGYSCKHLPWYAGERAKAPEFELDKNANQQPVDLQ